LDLGYVYFISVILVAENKHFFLVNTPGVITLISDMGYKDYYVAAVKGTIITALPDSKVIDITHQVPPFDIFKAAFILKNCYQTFPKGSIHIIGVKPEISVDTPHLIVRHNEHYFIGADNGIFSLIFDVTPTDVYELTMQQDTDDLTFPVKDVFAKAAVHLARGGTPELIAKRISDVRQVLSYRPATDENSIRGSVIYIDAYGNLITNITQEIFKKVGKNRPFTINFRSLDYQINEISKSYTSVRPGDKVAIFTSSGYLEIALNQGVEGSGNGANKLFGVDLYDTVVVEFGNGLL
jgi:S-adenosyl-L-methionine hydrolase (adenosine-forming)